MSNDVGGINKDERKANTMDVTPVGNGQPEENSSPVVVKTKPVVDTKPQSDINTTKREEHDTNGSASPVKRKQFRGKSDSEMEDGGSPTKKQRSEKAEHSSDEGHADKSAEHIHSTAKPSPKKQKQTKEKADTDDDDDEEEEELARMYDSEADISSLSCCCLQPVYLIAQCMSCLDGSMCVDKLF